LRFKSSAQFESHLAQVGQMIPELPPSELLSSSASLAGFMLSLDDVTEQLDCHIHREVQGVIVISHPSLQSVRVVQQHQQEQQQQQQQKGPSTIQVYGKVHNGNSVAGTAAPQGRNSSSSGKGRIAPWQQQLEQCNVGGVYEQQPAGHSSRRRNSSSQQQQQGGQQLLAEIEVWTRGQSARPVPVLVLPPVDVVAG
jgi:hypothetical protein